MDEMHFSFPFWENAEETKLQKAQANTILSLHPSHSVAMDNSFYFQLPKLMMHLCISAAINIFLDSVVTKNTAVLKINSRVRLDSKYRKLVVASSHESMQKF